ncbi:hypothetical protein LNP18_06580 [Leuconostoc citreum]|uniref:hypothetical protein n=1 Tax=Leuconostoc citreum TaxID=33964 RepID=UPI00200A396E|nr:hypothetical protein [Leuconostoc citreum]MCK8605770.1 hypothetical protein [Leuconostoc citreum]
MASQYDVYFAVDFFNEAILFTASSSGELSQKILQKIEKGSLASDGAVRLYRTNQKTLRDIIRFMALYNIPFHEAAIPKEVDDE